jgi:hypothetical protein
MRRRDERWKRRSRVVAGRSVGLMQPSSGGGIIGERYSVADGKKWSHGMSEDLSSQGGSKALPAGAHVPSHGHGYLRPVQPGEVRNPSGKGGLWREAQRITREKSPEAARRLGELMNSSDERVALMAADKVLQWAWGKPPDYDPREDKPPVTIDTSVLTREERTVLLAALRKGLLRSAEGPSAIEG